MRPGAHRVLVRHSSPKPWIHAVHVYSVQEGSDAIPPDPSRTDFSFEYDRRRDRLDLDVREERMQVRFGILRITFSWRGNDYEVRLFPLGKVDIRRGKEVLLEGHFTKDGVELKSTTPIQELEPIVPALSFGLGIRRQDHA